jgi:hypothetical protein
MSLTENATAIDDKLVYVRTPKWMHRPNSSPTAPRQANLLASIPLSMRATRMRRARRDLPSATRRCCILGTDADGGDDS